MRILCLDVGEKTIGVAVSDLMGWTAQGTTTLERKDLAEDLRRIGELVREKEADKIVIGLPLRMDGTEGTQAGKIRAFQEKVLEALEIPVELWDERLSTVAAERRLLEADLSRAKRKKVINKMAAVFILQGYLDAQKGGDDL